MKSRFSHLRERLRLPQRARQIDEQQPDAGQRAERSSTGKTIPVRTSRYVTRIYRNRQVRVGAIGLILALLAVWQIPRFLPGVAADEFTVLVAPFADQGGGVSQTGRAVANDLVRAIEQTTGRRVVVQAIDTPPADSAAALKLIESRDADALVWGEVIPGGMLDGETLLPMLAYHPTGAFAPEAWDGFVQRFALPRIYRLASAPINGRAVLPPLLAALADYAAGRVDSADRTLNDLSRSYPALAPTLPDTIRGTIAWARADDVSARDLLRGALTADPAAIPDGARAANNLGAALQDFGSPEARERFNQAIALLGKDGNADLGELRYNLAEETLASGTRAATSGQLAQAKTDFETARAHAEQAKQLLRPATPLQLTLSTIYRRLGLNAEADAALTLAARYADTDDVRIAQDLRELATLDRRSLVAGERGALDFAKLANAEGPLLWELQASDPLDERQLTAIRDRVSRAEQDATALRRRWISFAAAEDASSEPLSARIAEQQARHTDALIGELDYLGTELDVELVRATAQTNSRRQASFWDTLFGRGSESGRVRKELETHIASRAGDPEPLIELGRLLQASGDLAGAQAQFEAASRVAPQRPEPVFGLAQIAAASPVGDARDLCLKAIALDPSFFPARQLLAQLAERGGDWPTAIRERRWLAENRTSSQATFDLASALRQSGPSGYAEAEQVLLPLANSGDLGALLALSELYRASGNLAATREVLDRAQQVTVRGTPRFADVAYEVGRLYLDENNRRDAQTQFETALSADPRHVPSLVALALLNTDRPNIAHDYYRKALDTGTTDLTLLRLIGAAELDAAEFDAARDAYTRVVAAAPNDAESHNGLARSQLGLAQLADAEKQATTALTIRNGQFPEAQVTLGMIALSRNDLPAAQSQFSAAVAGNSSLADAYVGLGRVAAANQDWAGALDQFRAAVARAPTRPEPQFWLGEALLRRQQPDLAIDAYTKALSLRADFPEALLGLAQAQASQKRYADAEQSIAAALQLRPTYAEAFLVRGRIDEDQGDTAAANDAYSQAISANARLAEPPFRRGLIALRQKRLDDARSDLETAVRLQPEYPEARYWLGRVYFAQGIYRSAAEQLAKAVDQRGGSYAEAWYYRGLTEEQLNSRDDAIQALRMAVQQGDGAAWMPDAKAALLRLGVST